MNVKAKIRFNYGKKQYMPGDEIEMDDKDAKLLAAAGRITLDDDVTTNPKTNQKRTGDARAPAKRTVAAERPENAGGARQPVPERSAPADDDAKGGKKSRSGYKRRDMRATDTREDSGETGDE
ncbi:hypothetical protein CR51_27245 [Caballeronia megalochromosomata]|nr:hypothetical protein CR51_27245 [Caballeronia megalochromosomata]